MKEEQRTEITEEQRKARAVEILQQAILSAQNAGIHIRSGNHSDGFVVIIGGYEEKEGRLVKCENLPS